MIRIKKLLWVLIPALFLSCQPEGRVYVEHLELSPDVEWLKSDSREFKVTIEENNISYQESISFRFAYGYQFPELRIKVLEISPSGIEKTESYLLNVRDENGEYLGDPGYDIWDLEQVVEDTKKFEETGTYTYIIQHDMPQDPLYFAMEIGLILDKKLP